MRRYRILPSSGTLLVSTDLHGNLQDFLTLRAHFERLGPDAHWALLGDLVHGPSPDARVEVPELYDYPDDSPALLQALRALLESFPGRVHFVLGNHEHAHCGGLRCRKFYPDEAAHLEARLSPVEREALGYCLAHAQLALILPGGVLLCHASPDDSFHSLSQLEALSLAAPQDTETRALLTALLQAYGQRDERSRACLTALSRELGFPLQLVVHGHDRDEAGYFTEGETQACPVIFGAPRAQKTYLQLTLGASYESLADLRWGEELRRLYPAAIAPPAGKPDKGSSF